MLENCRERLERRESGFSLIELIVVLVILGLLATVVGPAVIRRLGEGKANIAKVQIANMENALNLFRFEVGRLPTTSEGLQSLRENSGFANWGGPYMEKEIPKDPWGNEYEYRCPGQHNDFDLWSVGPDGREGGDDDVTNW